MKKNFIKSEIIALRPSVWPEKVGIFVTVEDSSSYLGKLIAEAVCDHDHDEITDAWSAMLKMKSTHAPMPESEELTLAEALYVLFAEKSYYETKTHYAAFLDFLNKK